MRKRLFAVLVALVSPDARARPGARGADPRENGGGSLEPPSLRTKRFTVW